MKFEEYLQSIHAEKYIGTDDDMPDNFDNWLTGLDNEELTSYAEKWLTETEREYKLKSLEDITILAEQVTILANSVSKLTDRVLFLEEQLKEKEETYLEQYERVTGK